MLKFYLGTVAVWLIILCCTGALCRKGAKENGWLNPSRSRSLTSLLVAAIPILRLIVVVMMFYMAVTKKEESGLYSGEKREE